MRILAIRGKNLASLYGEFELPLADGPIAEAGVFSISGPTGAGKSTLVDALCLPLYGETPRFDERGAGVKPGREGDDEADLVDANDRRNLLSRGAADGHAEVDFEGVDGRRYRARWSVNRARGKPDGRLQNARMTLHDLDSGAPLSAKVEEVKRQVQAALGYSFAEFRRTVVLPQFEFRAFLDANTNTRARILERVTGTEIYAALSRKAHERAGLERVALEDLERRAGDLAVLGAEERAALEAEARGHERARELARKEKAAAEAEARWHEEEARLAGEVAEAALALARARAAAATADERRLALSEVEAAQPLRGARDEAVRTRSALAEAVATQESAERAAGAAGASLRDAEAGHRESVAALGRCLAEAEARRPALERARDLDVRAREAEPRLRKAEAALGAAEEQAERSRAQRDELQRRLVAEERRRARASGWLSAREAERTLVSAWPSWRARLAEHAELGLDLARAERAGDEARRRLAAATERRDALRASLEAHASSFARLESRAAAAARAAEGDDLAGLARGLRELVIRRDALAGLAALALEARSAAAERERAAAEGENARLTLSRLEGERQQAAVETAAAEAGLAAARDALARLDAALSLEERRAGLAEGEPCPLCGATSHPYAANAPARSVREAQAAAVEEAEAALRARRQEGEVRAGLRAAAEQLARSAGEAEARQAKALERAQARFADARHGWAGELPVAAAEATPVLVEAVAATTASLSAAEARQGKALARQEAVEEGRQAVEGARGALDGARARLAEAEVEVERAAGDARTSEGEGLGLLVRRDGLEAELESALGFRPGWRDEARAAPEALAKACAAMAASHAGRELEQREADAALAALAIEREAAGAALAERAARAAQAEQAAAAERADLDALQAERRELLGGDAVKEVERRQEASERARRAAVEASALRLGDEQRRLASAGTALAAANATVETSRARARVAAEELASALAAALGGRGLDRARLDLLLGRDAPWIAAERGELSALADALRDEQAKLAERQRRLDAHREGGGPGTALSAARARASRADDAEVGAMAARTALEARLTADDLRREALAALESNLARQRATARRWGELAELIGSHEGAELRVFAQGLALHALLGAANHHLAQLAPRYRLEAVPRCDLDIQVVDRDLGDEVRGVNGLSGGESFLVSLSLALGLSSLSTRQTQARTLFIDEGFGTLDRDTLEQAMAAIDQLGSGQRTVGVISHVPELHERIGVKVLVERVSAGRSRLVLPEGTPAPRDRAALMPPRKAS